MHAGGSWLKRYYLPAMTQDELDFVMRRSSRDVFDDTLHQSVERLIDDVRRQGDEALLRATAEFDGVDLGQVGVQVGPDEFEMAEKNVSRELLAAIDEAIDHVRRFNQHIVDHASWQAEIAPGIFVGEQASPIDRVGMYVPCRKGSFPSVMIHLGTPAVTAGVRDIAVVLPPLPGGAGLVDPAVLVVAGRLGITEVYRCNGVAGIAALAFGTETIQPVRRIDGPGSPGVTAAQLAVQRFGVAVGLLYGPSEAVILADASANPDLIAADLLNDAEHGSDSAALLLTHDAALIDAVAARVADRLAGLPDARRTYAEAATSQYGGAILVPDLASAIDFINEYAPEHLQLAVTSPMSVAPRIRNAGEILLGQGTPFAAANYSVGVPNTLPTGGFARLSSGVTAHTYLKRSSIAQLDASALAALRPGVRALTEHEGFPAHGAAMRAEGR
jgi:histidinol dehydrogenase